jgi:hypothetical protein
MWESRWLRLIGPGILSLGAVAAIASTAAGGGVRPWPNRSCPGWSASIAAETGMQATPDRIGIRGTPWFRLDPVLGDDGTLESQRLALGIVGDPVARTVVLPPESFASGPFGAIVLVGTDDGTRSVVRAFDVAAGCAWPIAEDADVIRRATLDPAGRVVYEMRVARADRADLGVWRRPIDGAADVRRVLGPPDPDPRFGRTFSTEFRWDLAGRRLAIQSCGEIACRTRLLTDTGEPAGSVEDPRLGGLVGVDGARVVTYAACRGLPCSIVATDFATGARRTLVTDGGRAVVVATAGGGRLVDELPIAGGSRLRTTDLSGAASDDLGALPPGVGLVPDSERAASGLIAPPGWIVLAVDGRVPADASAPRPLLRRIQDGITVPYDEALR